MTERECHGVVRSVLRVRLYLERTRFTARTDHNALRWALFMAKAEGRLEKWRLRLAEFDFDVVYRPSIKLSRMPNNGAKQKDLEDSIQCFLFDDSKEDRGVGRGTR